MEVEATTASPAETAADTIVIGVFEEEGVAHDLADGAIGRLLDTGEARSEPSSLAVLHAQERRYIVVGLGARGQFDAERARAVAAVAHGRARELGAATLCWEVPHHVGPEVVAGLVEGTVLHAYRFDRYKPAERARQMERLILSAHHDIADPVRRAAIVTAAQNRARDLGNTPSNDLTPAALAGYARELTSREPAISVHALDGTAIRDAGMGAFAAVAQGSEHEPRLIRLAYYGGGGASPLGLVGKAVTFDSGGLSLKPAGSMHEMKFDMAGGAAVIETVAALAELRAPVSVLGVVGATENLPSGSAVKPGDIVRALDGTTIEVNNTDAEGRLVLADCLTYTIREGATRLVDVATLTGGIVVALGSVYAGLFSNDEGWAGQVQAAAERSGELVWRQPLHREYARMVEGRYAQLTNRSERAREATAVTAAELLHHFAGTVPWAHLDIAGTAYDVRQPYFVGKGATGFAVRLMVELASAGDVTP
jgi:leucyl aminopeptidase